MVYNLLFTQFIASDLKIVGAPKLGRVTSLDCRFVQLLRSALMFKSTLMFLGAPFAEVAKWQKNARNKNFAKALMKYGGPNICLSCSPKLNLFYSWQLKTSFWRAWQTNIIDIYLWSRVSHWLTNGHFTTISSQVFGHLRYIFHKIFTEY